MHLISLCLVTSVVDPNRLCSHPDPDPISHVLTDPDPAPEPSRIQIIWDLDLTEIFKDFLGIKSFTVVKKLFWGPTLSSQLILSQFL